MLLRGKLYFIYCTIKYKTKLEIMGSTNKYLQLTSFERHLENPFLEKAIEDIERHKVRKFRRVSPKTGMKEAGQVVVQQNTGDVVAYGVFMQQIQVDEKQFAKIYVAELERFFDLNKTSRAVLNYVLAHLIPNKDVVTIRLQECADEAGYKTKKSVIEGIAHLIDAGLLARGKYENDYFINPLAMFNGDRVTYARTYIKEKEARNLKRDPEQLSMFGADIEDFENDTPEEDQTQSQIENNKPL
jgi:hypothetical protein